MEPILSRFSKYKKWDIIHEISLHSLNKINPQSVHVSDTHVMLESYTKEANDESFLCSSLRSLQWYVTHPTLSIPFKARDLQGSNYYDICIALMTMSLSSSCHFGNFPSSYTWSNSTKAWMCIVLNGTSFLFESCSNEANKESRFAAICHSSPNCRR